MILRKWIFLFAKIFFLLGVLNYPHFCLAQTARLTHIQFNSKNNLTRMSIFLSAPATTKVFTLSDPNRLVIDFENTQLQTSLNNSLQTKNNAINQIRSGHPKSSQLRLVCDLTAPIQFKVISPPGIAKIVIEMRSSDAHIRPVAVKKFPPLISSNLSLPPPVMTSTLPSSRPTVIVIDPGHGGKDPGAIGKSGTQEKNVTLAIAKRLAELINQQKNMRAVLTREHDYFVELRGRLKLARKGKADLFIALHADSYFNDRAAGASIYALSPHGATTEAARWLAQRDNYSELGGVNLRGLGDQSYLLRSVLIDLAQTATTTDSLHLGNTMLNSLDRITQLHYSRVEQAPFMVLKSPDIPSVLVEMGFISNEQEELRLRDRYYQNRMALALLDGIQNYLKKYPASVTNHF